MAGKSPYYRPVKEGGDRGRGSLSPLGGRSNPDQILRGGGSSGPLIKKPLEAGRQGEKPVTNFGRGKPIATAR
jgi:hypothetical protein